MTELPGGQGGCRSFAVLVTASERRWGDARY
ncbi:MAG: hypothetical protein QOD10_70 [Mycobacterium sp.]|jgi:hypothetical protein|nr:hypothetical protein [Mycobacterium sp.]